jgi:hypothetical protein
MIHFLSHTHTYTLSLSLFLSLKIMFLNTVDYIVYRILHVVTIPKKLFLGAFAKPQKVTTASSCQSVRPCVGPHGITRSPLDGFALFSKICRQNSRFIKIGHEQSALYTKMFSHLWQYIAEFFLEWEMFQIKVVEKIKIHVLCSVTFSENCALYEIMPKNVAEPETPQMTIHALHARLERLIARNYTPKPVHPHLHEIFNIRCFSTATRVSWTRLSVTLNVLWKRLWTCRLTDYWWGWWWWWWWW